MKIEKSRNAQMNAPDFFMVPSSIFKDRTLSVLEIMVEYLKEYHKLSYRDISRLINRNERTIWTCYSRAKQKRK